MKTKLLSILTLLLTMVQGIWADDKAEYGVLNGEFSVSAARPKGTLLQSEATKRINNL